MSTGAGNDIERLSNLARKMVMSWGMSKRLGTLSFGKREEAIFLGKEISTQKDYSEKTAELIDEEVNTVVLQCYNEARAVLETNIDLLNKMADALLEKETIDTKEIYELVRLYAKTEPKSLPAESKRKEEKEIAGTDESAGADSTDEEKESN